MEPHKSDINSASGGINKRNGEIPKVASLKLEKGFCSKPNGDKLFVLPSHHNDLNGLQFKTDHFQRMNKSITDVNSSVPIVNNMVTDEKLIPPLINDNAKKKNSAPSKLPLGVEIVVGSGSRPTRQDVEVNSHHKVKSPLPSDMLFASASLLRSYLGFSQDKAPKNELENDESMKDKMISLWHNMKYGWSANMKTNFSRETPIYLLGKVYHKSFTEDSAYQGSGFSCSNLDGFKQDFESIPWFTYRRKFPPLPDSTLTSDCGWGCMLRSAQMMVATAFIKHFLPSGWRYNSKEEDGLQTSIHRQIMKWFCDSPSKQSPFSIHNLVELGHKMNKRAGSWYGPSCVSHIFKEAIVEGAKEISVLDRLAIYVAQDGAVYTEDVIDICSTNKCICHEEKRSGAYSMNPTFDHCLDATLGDDIGNSFCEPYSVINKFGQEEEDFPVDLFVNSNREVDRAKSSSLASKIERLKEKKICEFCKEWKSCLILIPVRLGGSHVNPIYYDCLYSLLIHDLCIGIIGGRPKHSLYFVGFQEDSLIHLDPHFNQDSLSLDDPLFSLASFHCSSPKKISLSKMDPSATIGFYCHTQNQFLRLHREIASVATARDGNMNSPIFEFIDGKSSDVNGWLDRVLVEESVRLSMAETPPLSLEESEILYID